MRWKIFFSNYSYIQILSLECSNSSPNARHNMVTSNGPYDLIHGKNRMSQSVKNARSLIGLSAPINISDSYGDYLLLNRFFPGIVWIMRSHSTVLVSVWNWALSMETPLNFASTTGYHNFERLFEIGKFMIFFLWIFHWKTVKVNETLCKSL